MWEDTGGGGDVGEKSVLIENKPPKRDETLIDRFDRSREHVELLDTGGGSAVDWGEEGVNGESLGVE